MSETPYPERETNAMRAFMAFRDVLEAGMHPSLSSQVQEGNNWRNGEYDVVVETSPMCGLLHEQIKTLIEIAESHQGVLWLDRAGTLALLFECARDRTPGPISDEPSPGEVARASSRRGRKVKAKQVGE